MAWDTYPWKCISVANIFIEGLGLSLNGKKDRNRYVGLIIGLCLTIFPIFVNGDEALSLSVDVAPHSFSNPASSLPVGHSGRIGEGKPIGNRLVKRQALNETPLGVADKVSLPGSNSTRTTDIGSSDANADVLQDQESKNSNTKVASDGVLPVTQNPTGSNVEVVLSNKSKEAEQKSAESGVDEESGLGENAMNADAALRLFYVFVGVGVIVLIYILIKFLRLRRRRATRKYRVLARSDDQEMFPLAADEGDDEEIFNAADHQTFK